MPTQSTADIFLIFGPFESEVWELGYSFFFLFFVLALIREYVQGIMEGRANYQGLLTRALLISAVFFIYTPLFEEITIGMRLLSNFFMPDENFRDSIQKLFTAYKQNKDLGFIAWMKMTVIEWSVQGTYNLAYILMRVFSFVTVVLLASLYVTGPIFLGIGIFLPEMIENFVRWVFEICAWQVVLSLFVRVLTELNFFQFYDQTDPFSLDLVAMNFVVILMILIFVPLFSSMLIRGRGSFSGLGGAVIGLGGALAFRQAARGAKTAAGLIKRGMDGLKDRFPSKPDKPNSSYKGLP